MILLYPFWQVKSAWVESDTVKASPVPSLDFTTSDLEKSPESDHSSVVSSNASAKTDSLSLEW